MSTTPDVVRREFQRIGARLAAARLEDEGGPLFRIGVDRGDRFERFGTDDRFERFRMQGAGVAVDVLDVDVRIRQLLLMAASTDAAVPYQSRHLCGFDERHWFAATIRPVAETAVSTVAGAHEALKPIAVRDSPWAVRSGRPSAPDDLRIQRQGEWFFIPCPDLSFDIRRARRNVELRRSVGKPHRAQYLVGDADRFWSWFRGRDSQTPVYARGRIQHRDHRTLRLPCWHQVELNEEDVATFVGVD